ncbi:MAG: UDP-N-acetylmuramate dehydrogenase [Nitrospirae bacterium]|nr:MAG: UDP-N-acetylmuramate dehydrogenase [Nitrospirota bacterium]
MSIIADEHLWQEIISPDSFSGEVMFGEIMKRHTSLKIGGPADIFVFPQEVISLKNSIVALKKKNIPFMPVGGGTNLLVRDGGIEGVVVSLRDCRRIEVVDDTKDLASLFVESGVPLQKLVSFARENGFSGLEGLVGIPGSAGGAIAGNAGAYGYSMKNVVISATVMHADGRLAKLGTEELGLEYRKANIPAGSIILSANIRLRKDIKEDIAKRGEGFLKEKRGRQPLSELSAGCVFKNPEGTSGGKLIDEAGCKGMRIGDAEVSAVHANFLINKGNASASDFIKLMDAVRAKVLATFGVELETEIKVVGRENA